MASVVVREEADRFTMLLPIRMALSIFSESEIRASTLFALRFPPSDRALIRCRFTVVRAVSAEEKKADKASNSISIIICRMESGSKTSSPFVSWFLSLYIINISIVFIIFNQDSDVNIRPGGEVQSNPAYLYFSVKSLILIIRIIE